MALQKRNKALFIDKEAISTLAMVKSGLLKPIDKLMNSKEAKETDESGFYNGSSFPFSFILAPSGKRNSEVLKSVKKGEVLDLVCDGKKYGELICDETFEIEPLERVEKIFSTKDTTHPGVMDTLKRLGNIAICGDYSLEFNDIENNRLKIKEAINESQAKKITALMMAAKPLHRAHEKIIRMILDESDLVIIFLLKPYKSDIMPYSLREKTIEYFIENYLPRNRVIVIPLENTYIFAGNNEMILDAIVAQNYGCTKLVIGQNHAGLGVYYDKNDQKTVFDTLKGINIEIGIMHEYVYCDMCKTLVSTTSCPHGQHHHISYHSNSILELLKLGLLPPAVLVRKEISAIILSELYKNRFKNLERLYYDILPFSGLLENHSEEEFYVELMKLYQTTSLN